MSKRWMVAGCFLLTMSLAAVAEDPDTISAPGVSTPTREIPVLTGTAQSGNTSGHFQATIDPLIATRTPNASGVLADTADEHVDFGWHIPIFSLFTIGYDTGVNAFRQDQAIWDDEEATSQVTTALINKGSLAVQSGSNVNLTGYVQTQRSLTDGQPDYSDATKYGTDLAWTPLKDVTTVKADASTQETVNFNHSILDEDFYTTSLDQKLPYLPLTLHTAGSLTDDTAPLLAADDKDNVIVDASLLWKIVPSASCSTGLQRQDASIPASLQLADTDTYFTQVSLQTSQAVTLTVRAAHEQTNTTAADQFLSTSSDVLLTFGLTWNLGDRFNLGAGLNYRALQSQTPTPTIGASPTSFSLSAGGHF
jgi:hypothetical protein